jgi:hypothetical protein
VALLKPMKKCCKWGIDAYSDASVRRAQQHIIFRLNWMNGDTKRECARNGQEGEPDDLMHDQNLIFCKHAAESTQSLVPWSLPQGDRMRSKMAAQALGSCKRQLSRRKYSDGLQSSGGTFDDRLAADFRTHSRRAFSVKKLRGCGTFRTAILLATSVDLH